MRLKSGSFDRNSTSGKMTMSKTYFYYFKRIICIFSLICIPFAILLNNIKALLLFMFSLFICAIWSNEIDIE